MDGRRKSKKKTDDPIDAILSGRETLFNGKPLAHWKRLARELVVELLIRAACLSRDSIVGRLAQDRLMELANQEDPDLVRLVLEQRETMRANLARFMGGITGRRRPRQRHSKSGQVRCDLCAPLRCHLAKR